jgi:hypothetical protein
VSTDRRSTRLLQLSLGLALLLATAAAHAFHARRERGARLADHAAIARRLELTDLCLFLEARYTRHPSQADRFSPFQEHPGALEHFPSGSLAGAPR